MTAEAKKGYGDRPWQGMEGREDSTDPMRLRAGKKERKRHAKRRESIQRGGTLERLLTMKAIGQAQYLSGCKIRDLVAMSKGVMPSTSNFATERVDGGSNKDRDWLILCSLGDAMALEAIKRFVGFTDYILLIRVCGEGESLASIAVEFEDDDVKRKANKPSKQTRDHVARRLRDGLKSAAYVLGFATRAGDKDIARHINWWRSEERFSVPTGFEVVDGRLVEIEE